MGFTRKLLTAKGDLLTRDAAQLVRLAPGANGEVLTADASQPKGIKWAAAAPAGASSTDAVISASGATTNALTVKGTGVYTGNALSFLSTGNYRCGFRYETGTPYTGSGTQMPLVFDHQINDGYASGILFNFRTTTKRLYLRPSPSDLQLVTYSDVNFQHDAGTYISTYAGYSTATGCFFIGGQNGGGCSIYNHVSLVQKFSGTNIFNYHSYTDASNYQGMKLSVNATSVTLGAATAGTGADNLNVVLAPTGSGIVQAGATGAYADFHANKLFLGTNACNISPSSVSGTLDITSVQGVQIISGGIIHSFDAWGNVGIGTPNPTAKLDVQGNVAVSGFLDTSGGVCVQGTQVVTSPQPAIPDATGGTVEATLNALLASLRTHGLIAA